jgi:hypothetical protein
MKQTSIFKTLSEKRRKVKNIYNNKVYVSELEPRLQYCLRNLQIACKAVQIAIPLGELKLKLKNGGNI